MEELRFLINFREIKNALLSHALSDDLENCFSKGDRHCDSQML